jgi:hypothetical protein
VHTDGCTLPVTSLFNIGQHCLRYGAHFTEIGFYTVGCLIAKTRYRYTMTVMYRQLTDAWRDISKMSVASRVYAWDTFGFSAQDQSLAGRALQAYFARVLLCTLGYDSPFIPPDDSMRTLAKHCPAFGSPDMSRHEFWTIAACPYVPYRSSLFSR